MAQQLTPEIIQAAIEGLTARQDVISRQIAELRAMLPANSNGNSAPKRDSQSRNRGGKRQLSPEARERIADAQRKRWAAVRGDGSGAALATAKLASSTTPKKRRLSAAGRKAIQEAVRRRWAAKRAASTPSKAARPKLVKRGTAKKSSPAADAATD
jgi:hypothetical protein